MWYVIMLVNGNARISDSSITRPGDGIGVVYRGQTIQACQMYLDRNDIQESQSVSFGKLMLDKTIAELRAVGFDDAQIARVVVANRMLQPEG